jgi:predicted lipoprotein with Yx(FWY)xxD motif
MVRAAVAAVAIGVGVAATAATAAAPVGVYTSKQSTAIGKVLVNSTGRTLYHYSSERKNVVRCTGVCAKRWPPLVIAARVKPAAGSGVVASRLGTVKRPDGKLQVTYRGLPLYLYSGDKKAGDLKGHGSAGSWYAMGPSGAILKVTTSPVSKGTGGSGTGGSGTGGSGMSPSPPPSGTPGTSVNCDANPAAEGCGM